MGLLHLLAAPHEICLADGELVERASEPAPAVVEGARARPGADGTDRVAPDGVTEGPGRNHDRCLATPDDPDALPSAPPASVFATSEERPLVHALFACSMATGPPVYRVAPKNSPPA